MKRLELAGFVKKDEGEYSHRKYPEAVTLSVSADCVDAFKFELAVPAHMNLKEEIGVTDDELIIATYEDLIFPELLDRDFDMNYIEEGFLIIGSTVHPEREMFIDLDNKEYGASEAVNPDAVIPILYEAVNHPYFDEYIAFLLSLKEVSSDKDA